MLTNPPEQRHSFFDRGVLLDDEKLGLQICNSRG
jgi:hypothetical protein